MRLTLIGLVTAATSIFALPAKAADTSITNGCVTFTWPNTIYRPLPLGSVSFGLSYKNNCTYEILNAKYQLVDKFGTSLATDGIIGLKSGVTSNQSQTWLEFFLSKGAEPLTLRFIVENYAGFGISNPVPIIIPFKFEERIVASPTPRPSVTVTAQPTPAPTVTVTAQPTQSTTDRLAIQTLSESLSIIQNELNVLKVKIKKICAFKPKPKGC